jgi:hypothetical protein
MSFLRENDVNLTDVMVCPFSYWYQFIPSRPIRIGGLLNFFGTCTFGIFLCFPIGFHF